MKKNRSAVRRIGLFLGILFGMAGLISLYHAIINGFSFVEIVKASSVSFSILLFFIFTISSNYNKLPVKIIHVFFIFTAGCLALTSEPPGISIHGEFTIILGLMTARIYGLFKRKVQLPLIFTILCCFILKFVVFKEIIIQNPIEYFYYMILVAFFSTFFLLINTAEEGRITDEANIICEQWTKEQVYNDIGRSVFSTFMHDYHTDHAVAHLHTLKEMLDEEEIDDAKSLADELMNMLRDDNDNILRVKEKIRLSTKDKPEVINSLKVLQDKIEYYKKAYNLNDQNIQLNFRSENDNDLYVIPSDFAGIIENLIKNAIEAATDFVLIRIDLFIYRNSGEITVVNSGRMIPWREKDGTVLIDGFSRRL